ncbi:MAG: hypothetical protein J0I45_16340 [Bosea sp.]|nr:hypothetical protein [Bosea sp. (in: a-proteobacteria)]
MIGNATDILATFKKRANEESDSLSATILSGPYATFDEYKNAIGRLAGLRMALAILQDIERQHEKDILGR